MRKKRFLAVIMAASMVLGNSAMALATTTDDPAIGQLSGDISLEGVVDPDVFEVVLPTISADGVKDAFDFVMDPQELIYQTNAARYISTNAASGGLRISTNQFERGTLYFANYVSENSSSVNKISPSSNMLTITNKGTMDVHVGLSANITNLNGVTLASSNSISAGDDPSVYLTVKDDMGSNRVISANGAFVSAVISGNNGAYNISWNRAKSKYEKTASDNATFSDYSFYLEGASGGDIDKWLELEPSLSSGNAKVNVIWIVSTEAVEDPRTPATPATPAGPFADSTLTLVAGQPAETALSLPDGATDITSVTWVGANGGTATLTKDTDYQITNGKLRFKVAYVNTLMNNANVTSRVHTVTFNNTPATTATITLTK